MNMKPDPSALTREQLEAMTAHLHELVTCMAPMIEVLVVKLEATEGLPAEASRHLDGFKAAIDKLFKASNARSQMISNSPSGKHN